MSLIQYCFWVIFIGMDGYKPISDLADKTPETRWSCLSGGKLILLKAGLEVLVGGLSLRAGPVTVTCPARMPSSGGWALKMTLSS